MVDIFFILIFNLWFVKIYATALLLGFKEHRKFYINVPSPDECHTEHDHLNVIDHKFRIQSKLEASCFFIKTKYKND